MNFRHSSQIGTRLALVNSLSQILHPVGKNTFTTVSLASVNHPRTPLRHPRAVAKGEPAPIAPREICSS
jgi:hypothetical protein